jgi:hypothetical protein
MRDWVRRARIAGGVAISVGALVAGANVSSVSPPQPILVAASTSSPANCAQPAPRNALRACYYRAAQPGRRADFVGAVDEPSLGSPVPDRAYGLDHDWGVGPIFAGVAPGPAPGDAVSASWQGVLRYPAGKYQVTLWSSGGVRLAVDGRNVVNQWGPDGGRFGVALTLSAGYHLVQLTWYMPGGTGRPSLLRLHWDRLPTVPQSKASRVRVDVFVVTSQQTCIAGDPWVSGPQVVVHNADGSTERAWQVDDVRGLPLGFVPSDPALSQYPQVECYQFGYSPAQVNQIRSDVAGFRDLLVSWSFGALIPDIRVHTISGPIGLHRISEGFWISPGFFEQTARPYESKETDFSIVMSSTHDPRTGRYYDPFACGGTLGADHGMWGAGYSWVPCHEPLVILHEFEHQLTFAMDHLLGFRSIYPDGDAYPQTGFPSCGRGDPDIFRWFPDSEDWGTEPDSPWCGLSSDQAGIAEMHLLAHLDPSLKHYPLGRITGNHCDDAVLDYGETAIDAGGNCLASGPSAWRAVTNPHPL